MIFYFSHFKLYYFIGGRERRIVQCVWWSIKKKKTQYRAKGFYSNVELFKTFFSLINKTRQNLYSNELDGKKKITLDINKIAEWIIERKKQQLQSGYLRQPGQKFHLLDMPEILFINVQVTLLVQSVGLVGFDIISKSIIL